MEAPWHRPYECDDWHISTFYQGKTLFRRRPKWGATAIGRRDVTVHVRYTVPIKGHSREEAETKMRAVICDAIKRYREYLDYSKIETTSYKADCVCPKIG